LGDAGTCRVQTRNCGCALTQIWHKLAHASGHRATFGTPHRPWVDWLGELVPLIPEGGEQCRDTAAIAVGDDRRCRWTCFPAKPEDTVIPIAASMRSDFDRHPMHAARRMQAAQRQCMAYWPPTISPLLGSIRACRPPLCCRPRHDPVGH